MQTYRTNRRRNNGFTIVELLIVIVVIAILAAISIVAYNGIQARSQGSQVISGVNAYYKAFLSYKAVHGSYPAPSSPGSYCLGANYPSDQCWTGSGNFSIDNQLDAALAEFLPTKPTLATSRFPIGDNLSTRAGLLYISSTNQFHWEFSEKNQACGLSGATGSNYSIITYCTKTLP